MANEPTHPTHFELGDVRVDIVSAGRFALDGGAMFGVVPKPLWSRVTESDERNRIVAALEASGGVKARAAEMLGMGRTTLWRKMKEYGIAD